MAWDMDASLRGRARLEVRTRMDGMPAWLVAYRPEPTDACDDLAIRLVTDQGSREVARVTMAQEEDGLTSRSVLQTLSCLGAGALAGPAVTVSAVTSTGELEVDASLAGRDGQDRDLFGEGLDDMDSALGGEDARDLHGEADVEGFVCALVEAFRAYGADTLPWIDDVDLVAFRAGGTDYVSDGHAARAAADGLLGACEALCAIIRQRALEDGHELRIEPRGATHGAAGERRAGNA